MPFSTAYGRMEERSLRYRRLLAGAFIVSRMIHNLRYNSVDAVSQPVALVVLIAFNACDLDLRRLPGLQLRYQFDPPHQFRHQLTLVP